MYNIYFIVNFRTTCHSASKVLGRKENDNNIVYSITSIFEIIWIYCRHHISFRVTTLITQWFHPSLSHFLLQVDDKCKYRLDLKTFLFPIQLVSNETNFKSPIRMLLLNLVDIFMSGCPLGHSLYGPFSKSTWGGHPMCLWVHPLDLCIGFIGKLMLVKLVIYDLYLFFQTTFHYSNL